MKTTYRITQKWSERLPIYLSGEIHIDTHPVDNESCRFLGYKTIENTIPFSPNK